MIARQFSVYIIVGIVSAVTDIGLMQLLITFNIHYLVSATFGFFAGLVVNFTLHSRITFKEDYSHVMLARYIAVVLANYVLVLIIVQIFNSWLSMPILGKVVSLPLVALNGFFLSKYWIYRSDER
ncbi:GtrA family protein [Vreelandella sp. F11]|uniref:GtrA family protein n=1 Tax=Vreelandella sp. F11 TaxID=3394751 RepID=UPI0036DE3D14